MIYYDNAATTKMYEVCADIIKEYGCNKYFNPSALYNPSIDVLKAIILARKTIADIIDVDQDEIYFTGSGTEADNLALFGVKKRKNETQRDKEA
jgi:cysteine desulfurase